MSMTLAATALLGGIFADRSPSEAASLRCGPGADHGRRDSGAGPGRGHPGAIAHPGRSMLKSGTREQIWTLSLDEGSLTRWALRAEGEVEMARVSAP